MKPSFFIIGAPKCGTTALYDYLQQHPAIWLPRKEIHFFGKDFTFRHTRPTLDYYLSLFGDAPESATLLGEASVWYLYSKTAAEEIKAFNSNAKIIAMIRRPTDMLYSLHSQQLFAGNEDIANFEQALAAEQDRLEGKRLPPLIGCPYESLYYSQVPCYTEQIKRYWAAFGKDNVLIILFDDFVRDTATVYAQTLSFLGLDPSFKPSFNQVNPNKTVRSALWRDILKQRPTWLVKLVKVLLPSRQLRYRMENKLWAMNSRQAPRPPLPTKIRERLNHQFVNEIQQLSDLLQRDLSAWLG